MDNSINNISFRAQLATKMNGRYGLLEQVGKKFAQKTKNIPGELKVHRYTSEHPKAIIFSYENKSYVITDYADLMGNNLTSKKEITSKLTDKIANRFANICRALKADIDYNDKTADLITNINSATRTLRINRLILNSLVNKGQEEAAEKFKKVIARNESRLAKLTAKLDIIKDSYKAKLGKMVEKEPKLEVWSEIVLESIN